MLRRNVKTHVMDECVQRGLFEGEGRGRMKKQRKHKKRERNRKENGGRASLTERESAVFHEDVRICHRTSRKHQQALLLAR